MRGGPARALLRSVIYVLLACLLMLAGSAAYASQTVSALPFAAVSPPQTLVRPLPPAIPAPPVTTVLAAYSFDQLRSDLETMAARSGERMGISVVEMRGPGWLDLTVRC